jgi:tricorn protease-like protein
LRLRLARYYESNGDDPCIIRLPKGSYVPIFEERAPPLPQRPDAPPRRSHRRIWIAAAPGFILAAGFVFWYLRNPVANSPKLTRITSDAGRAMMPALSRSGEMIVYASDRAGRGDFDVYVQAVRGADALRLTTDPADDVVPKFSPDGSRIAFVRMGGTTPGSPRGIFVVPVVGGKEHLIAMGGGEPRYSPDGAWIAFTRVFPSITPTDRRPVTSFVIRQDGTGEREICPGFWLAGVPYGHLTGATCCSAAARSAPRTRAATSTTGG